VYHQRRVALVNRTNVHFLLYPLAMLAALGAYAWLKINPQYDLAIVAPTGHFYIVSSVAFVALIISVLVGISAVRLRNIGVTLLAVAFISLAEVFTAHGLSTPGFVIGPSHVPSIAAELSVSLTAFWLWMSSIRSDHPVIEFLGRWQRVLVPLWVTLLAVLFLVAMANPSLANFFPVDTAPLAWGIAFVTILFAALAAYRYWKSFRYSQLPLQIAVVYSAGYLAIAQMIIVTGQTWHLSWWLYHLMLLATVVVMVVGVVQQYASGSSLAVAVRGLFSTDPIQRIEAGISPRVRSLIVATEAKDKYTAGHNFRVALYALRLGEEMGLAPEQLRALAQGAIIHDIGKIEVPDSVLNKPGKLTPEERKLIEKHPVTGYEMCKRLGFMKDELDIIRHHHEKWDGTGYPDGKAGTSIPKLARIVAVADVYDALTSARSYRAPWTHDDAMRFIVEQSGKHFDPECVQAWVALNEREPIVVEHPSWVCCDPFSTQNASLVGGDTP
jgi:putative nucleotidyltransferase with HDIG domain